jgi:hypothetical protein
MTSPAGPEAVQHSSTATPPAGNVSDKLPPDSDLPQRPRMTSPPGVRIEGIAGNRKISQGVQSGLQFAVVVRPSSPGYAHPV